jgi:pimeloyl-ACP methyl ester carboxylesterase
MGSWQSTRVVVDGVDLLVHRTGGNKPPVVLMHGITDSGLCWSRLARDLAADYDVIMVDARGHGGSAHPGLYSFTEHVGDLTGVLRVLDLSPVVLVGHSMSGPHVAATAAGHPDLVAAVVLVDPHWPLHPEDPADYDIDGWRAAIAVDNNRSTDDLLALGRRDNPTWSEEDLWPWAHAKQTVDPAVPTWLYSHQDLNRWRAIVQQIQCPTLLVTGDAEVDSNVTVGPEGAEQAQQLCPSLTVAHIPRAGHSIHRDQYTNFRAAVTAFLADVIAAEVHHRPA